MPRFLWLKVHLMIFLWHNHLLPYLTAIAHAFETVYHTLLQRSTKVAPPDPELCTSKFWLVFTNFFKGVQHDLPCSCIWNQTIFTRSLSRGSKWHARLCAQLISCMAEWIFPDNLYCFAKWMIYNPPLVSEAGRLVITV